MKRGFEVVDLEEQEEIGTRLPERKTTMSAGYDFFLNENVMILPQDTSPVISTNVKAYMQKDEVLELHIRSSLGFKKGVTLANATGIIDADYYNNKDNDGLICAKLFNSSNETVFLEKGEAFIQGIFKKYLVADNGNLDQERKGGIGSTDDN